MGTLGGVRRGRWARVKGPVPLQGALLSQKLLLRPQHRSSALRLSFPPCLWVVETLRLCDEAVPSISGEQAPLLQ